MNSLQGHLLVASPQLRDPNFVRTVVLMVQHNEQGALGVVLNRPTTTTVGEAWKQVSEDPSDLAELLHHGGPCDGPLMVIHDHEPASQLEVVSGIYFSAEKDNVQWLIEQGHDPAKYFVGCAGWGPGQLEAELETGSWRSTPATTDQVFHGGEDLWSTVTQEIVRCLSLATINPKIIPKDPSMN